jgi:hypothetical protein
VSNDAIDARGMFNLQGSNETVQVFDWKTSYGFGKFLVKRFDEPGRKAIRLRDPEGQLKPLPGQRVSMATRERAVSC